MVDCRYENLEQFVEASTRFMEGKTIKKKSSLLNKTHKCTQSNVDFAFFLRIKKEKFVQLQTSLRHGIILTLMTIPVPDNNSIDA